MTPLTYAEVGATETGELPPGYRHLRYRTAIGRDVFAVAAEAVLTWRMHRAAGIKVDTASAKAAPGVDVTMHIGPLPAPCRVVWVVDEPNKAGWGYGTLPGHPARGEESFVVSQGEDGVTWFEVTAFSVPAGFLMKAAGPGARLFQRTYAAWCARALRRLVKS
ncbi:Uncharacterized protein, UPF0548 family [Asanoa hainanensis]|uniref:Uncharacterized protein, UPF0548 family n=1 Tax=Asanoa hainanensis TaxID=560556 RepID=A0A239LNL3_9ACTN|nr:DUF1990 domain-containing protein [Asanoa hainanensis]SNT31880.1 Uncharacterized protein, UPF0548 family [Asanoa hainanensis]